MTERSQDAPVPGRITDTPALTGTWSASLLRDGFALTFNGANLDFADLTATSLAAMLKAQHVDDVDGAVDRVMRAFTSLPYQCIPHFVQSTTHVDNPIVENTGETARP